MPDTAEQLKDAVIHQDQQAVSKLLADAAESGGICKALDLAKAASKQRSVTFSTVWDIAKNEESIVMYDLTYTGWNGYTETLTPVGAITGTGICQK